MEFYKLGSDGKTPVLLKDGEPRQPKHMDRIARDVLENGKVVSTAFLFIDHSFDEGTPVLFETMVFPSNDCFDDIDMDRYTGWEAAISGHTRLVEKHKKALPN